jgi:hypothetical protein
MHLPLSLSQMASLRLWERLPRFVVPTSSGCIKNPTAHVFVVVN